MVLDVKSSQEYPVNAGDSQSSILGPILFLLNISLTLLMMLPVILISMLMILISSLSAIKVPICGNN